MVAAASSLRLPRRHRRGGEEEEPRRFSREGVEDGKFRPHGIAAVFATARATERVNPLEATGFSARVRQALEPTTWFV